MELPKHIRLNSGLHAVDRTVQEASRDLSEQIGILFMAHALAFRRLLAANNIVDRGRRMKLLKAAVNEFDSKLRKYAHFEPLPEVEMSPVFFAEKRD